MLSNRVTLSPLVQSAMRPGLEIERSKNPCAVERDGELVVDRPHRQRMPTVRCNVGVDACDLLGRAAAHAEEQNPIPQRIYLNEIVVSRPAQSHGDPATPI